MKAVAVEIPWSMITIKCGTYTADCHKTIK